MLENVFWTACGPGKKILPIEQMGTNLAIINSFERKNA